MDESIKCECGETTFWWFGEYLRCPSCYNEYKQTGHGDSDCVVETWLRRFNNELKAYPENWEHWPTS